MSIISKISQKNIELNTFDKQRGLRVAAFVYLHYLNPAPEIYSETNYPMEKKGMRVVMSISYFLKDPDQLGGEAGSLSFDAQQTGSTHAVSSNVEFSSSDTSHLPILSSCNIAT